jgi:hypothetical protein
MENRTGPKTFADHTQPLLTRSSDAKALTIPGKSPPSPMARFCPLPAATPEEILRHLATLEASLPSERMTDDARSLRAQVFANDLKDYPSKAIGRACERYRTTPPKDGQAKFFPDPGTLLELVRLEMRDLDFQYEPWAKARPAKPGPILSELPARPAPREPERRLLSRFNPGICTDEDRAILERAKARLA